MSTAIKDQSMKKREKRTGMARIKYIAIGIAKAYAHGNTLHFQKDSSIHPVVLALG